MVSTFIQYKYILGCYTKILPRKPVGCFLGSYIFKTSSEDCLEDSPECSGLSAPLNSAEVPLPEC